MRSFQVSRLPHWILSTKLDADNLSVGTSLDMLCKLETELSPISARELTSDFC
jgi:hypothetical protein